MNDITITSKNVIASLREQYNETEIARFLLNCLHEIGTLPDEATVGHLDNIGLKTADPNLYGNFRADVRNILSLFWKSNESDNDCSPIMIDLGGGKGENDGFREGMNYIVVDFSPDDPHAINIKHDLNTSLPFRDEVASFVYSNQVFEHVENPFLLANEIGRILKPGGFAFISTVFSYRFHPFPHDFWRFTHKGLSYLMSTHAGLNIIQSKYELTHRRDDRRGARGSSDEVHVDWLGGFRENWFVYSICEKGSTTL